MVEIIGRDESAFKELTHKACGTKLRYVPNDVVNLWSGKDYSGGSDGANGFKCPACGKDVIIERW
jgi:hypothetical protein